MADEILMTATNIIRFYGKYKAVSDFNLQLKRGDVLGLLGENGAGKTTTMRILTGNLAPHQGEIKIAGIDLLSRPTQAKKHLGYLPEQPPIYKDLTLLEYLKYCGQLHQLQGKHLQKAIEYALAKCDLSQVKNRLIGHLSKGFQQRVGIAQAILHKPTIIILDEPTVGLDPVQMQEIRKLIPELAEEHSIIFSTHLLNEVEHSCNRVMILKQGKVVFSEYLEQLKIANRVTKIKLAAYNLPSQSVLSALPGVTTVEILDQQQCYLSGNITQATYQALNIQAADWQVYMLCPLKQDLEHIFMQYVYKDEFL